MGKPTDAKAERVLSIYSRLLQGKVIYKEEESLKYDVAQRTIQRDIADIQCFLQNQSNERAEIQTITFDRKTGGYRLETKIKNDLEPEELLSVCKILLESRALVKDEMFPVIYKLLGRYDEEEQHFVKECIRNELYHYVELNHHKKLLNNIWVLERSIKEKRYLEIRYRKMKDREEVIRKIKPVGVMFSEFYFYLTAYIERDVRELSDAIDSFKFLRFITAVAARCGQMLNVADIARDADINQTQTKNWLGILETLGIIFYLHPYSNNLLKRLVKTPKLYFYDTGLVCYLTKWSNAETLESGAMNGAILENYVVAEIMKTYLNSGKEPYLYYYRNKDAKEIDIVLEHDGVLNPIEIKKTSTPGTELIKVFDLLDKSSTPRSKGAVICMKPELGAINRDNYIVPIWMI